jgi:hypothetical protein
MNKIPVGDTISKSYAFGFGDILSVFGIAWFPYVALLAIAAGFVFLLAPGLPHMVMQGDFDPMQLVPLAPVFGLLGLLSYVVQCMVTVGVQNKALGRHPGPVFFYFSLGGSVWRMVGAMFLASLVIVFIGLLTAGICVAVWFAAGAYVPNYALAIRCVVIAVAVLWIIYMVVRLTFFLPAVVVAEERIGLGRSWELGGGNFWRIVIVFLAVFLPVAIGLSIVFSALLGPMFAMPHWHDGQDVHELMRQIIRDVLVISPLAIVLSLVRRIIYLGLGNGMIANAYLAVVG